MVIKNNDGTPWKPLGTIQQFLPQNPAHDLFNFWDQEIIRQGGTPLFYFEVFIQLQTVDKLYLEDRGKLWAPKGIELYGFYEPVEQQTPSTAFGLDAPDEVILELNYRAFLETVGHPPKRGSRVFTPHRSENWVIVDTRLAEFKLWGAIRLQLICQKFQESTTTGEGSQDLAKIKPDYTIF
jgi:hypothetical protein